MKPEASGVSSSTFSDQPRASLGRAYWLYFILGSAVLGTMAGVVVETTVEPFPQLAVIGSAAYAIWAWWQVWGAGSRSTRTILPVLAKLHVSVASAIGLVICVGIFIEWDEWGAAAPGRTGQGAAPPAASQYEPRPGPYDARFNAMVEQLEARLPSVDPRSPAFDEGIVRQLKDRVAEYEMKGFNPLIALQNAVVDVTGVKLAIPLDPGRTANESVQPPTRAEPAKAPAQAATFHRTMPSPAPPAPPARVSSELGKSSYGTPHRLPSWNEMRAGTSQVTRTDSALDVDQPADDHR